MFCLVASTFMFSFCVVFPIFFQVFNKSGVFCSVFECWKFWAEYLHYTGHLWSHWNSFLPKWLRLKWTIGKETKSIRLYSFGWCCLSFDPGYSTRYCTFMYTMWPFHTGHLYPFTHGKQTLSHTIVRNVCMIFLLASSGLLGTNGGCSQHHPYNCIDTCFQLKKSHFVCLEDPVQLF